MVRYDNNKNFIKMEYICTISFTSKRGSYYDENPKESQRTLVVG